MLSQTAHLDNNIAKYHHDEYSPHPFTMDKVLAIGTSFITSLTPQSKRRRTLTPHLADTSTPTTSLHPYSYPTSEPHNSRAVHAAKTDTHHKYLSPSNANFSRQKPETQTPRKRRRSDSHGIEDYVESENSSAIGPDDSASNIARYNDDEDTILTAPDSERGHRIGNGYKRKKQRVATYSSSESNADVDDGVDDGNEEELVTEESEVDSINLAPEDEEAIAEEANPNEDISREELFARRKSNIEEARAAGWHEDEIVVYAKLTMRGFEPLMSKYWWKDFRTCPSSLFSDAKEDWVISSQSGNEYRGTFTEFKTCYIIPSSEHHSHLILCCRCLRLIQPRDQSTYISHHAWRSCARRPPFPQKSRDGHEERIRRLHQMVRGRRRLSQHALHPTAR